MADPKPVGGPRMTFVHDLIKSVGEPETAMLAKEVASLAFDVLGEPDQYADDHDTKLSIELSVSDWSLILTGLGLAAHTEASNGYGGSAMAFALACQDLATELAVAKAPATAVA